MKKGFTLIEMLVVVLIIGILASIALPQYQKIIAKSKSAQMYEAVSSLAKSAQTFYLVQGSWPATFDSLDINYPNLSDETTSLCDIDINGTFSSKRNNDFIFTISARSTTSFHFNSISVFLADGPYKCTGFSIYLHDLEYPNLENKFLCSEGGSVRGSKNKRGDFCEKVMGYTFFKRRGGVDLFY